MLSKCPIAIRQAVRKWSRCRTSGMRCVILVSLLTLTTLAYGNVETYEGNVLPEDAGWERVGSGRADRVILDGWFVQTIRIEGALDAYRKPLNGYADTDRFFIEWRAQTDAPSSILEVSGVPVVVSASGFSGTNYHTTMTDARVQLLRDTPIPLVFFEIAASVAHTYRLELYGTVSFTWYIDGEVADTGAPQGPYPNPDSVLVWGSRYYVRKLPAQTTRWDYVRYGRIPADGSGDFDSDDSVDLGDFYFFHECLTNRRLGINGAPDNDAGPGCRFADFDDDADVDLRDIADLQNTFTGPD